MSEQKQKEIVLGRNELDPAEAERHKKMIEAARSTGSAAGLKGSTPLGHVAHPKNTPLFTKEARPGPNPISEEGGVQPRPPGSPVLRPETMAQLQGMKEAQEKAEKESQAKVEAELSKDINEQKEDLFEMFDFGARNEADKILNNKKRRAEIEKRLEPMRLEDLILKNEVTQDVVLVPGKFTAKFRSTTPQESLFVKRLMSDETVTSDQYLMEKFSIYNLVCSLVSVNDVNLVNHLDENGEPNDDLFKKKLKIVLKKSMYVIADLGLNWYWFDLRVRRLLNPDDLKNG